MKVPSFRSMDQSIRAFWRKNLPAQYRKQQPTLTGLKPLSVTDNSNPWGREYDDRYINDFVSHPSLLRRKYWTPERLDWYAAHRAVVESGLSLTVRAREQAEGRALDRWKAGHGDLLGLVDLAEGHGPPVGNTGANPTSHLLDPRLKQRRVSVDWVEFTVPDRLSEGLTAYQVIQYLLNYSPEDFVRLGGRYGYAHRLVCCGVSVYFDGMPGMGIHVELTGQGCREFEVMNPAREGELWSRFVRTWLLAGAKFTRFDVALDVFDELVTVDRVRQHLLPAEGYVVNRRVKRPHPVTGELVPLNVQETPNTARCRFRSAMSTRSFDAWDGRDEGETLYWGSPNSLKRLRVYDKAKEQGVDFPWVRFELQLRKERAHLAAADLIAGDDYLGELTRGLLADTVAFVEPIDDVNYSRWPLAGWWALLLEGVSRLALTCPPPERSLGRTQGFVEKQAGPSLALLFRACSGNVTMFNNWVTQLVQASTDKLKQRHLMLLRPGFELVYS